MDLEKAAQAFNIVADNALTKSADCEIWEDNWAAVDMFLRLQTQWRVGMGGPLGLDYGAAEWLFRLCEVEDQRSLLEDLQVMEYAVLAAIAKREA